MMGMDEKDFEHQPNGDLWQAFWRELSQEPERQSMHGAHASDVALAIIRRLKKKVEPAYCSDPNLLEERAAELLTEANRLRRATTDDRQPTARNFLATADELEAMRTAEALKPAGIPPEVCKVMHWVESPDAEPKMQQKTWQCPCCGDRCTGVIADAIAATAFCAKCNVQMKPVEPFVATPDGIQAECWGGGGPDQSASWRDRAPLL